MAARLEAMGVSKYDGLTRRSGKRSVWTGEITLDHAALDVPLHWTKPRMIFVNSMSDLFHDKVPPSFVAEVWNVMQRSPQHTFQILTKRPDRMGEITRELPKLGNVWLGTSVESAPYLFRLDQLRIVRAAVRFASFEPLLGSLAGVSLRSIAWAIVGGESGPRARPMEKRWVDEIMEACKQSRTAFFFKQWGGVNKSKTGRILHGKTWDNMPIISGVEYVAQ